MLIYVLRRMALAVVTLLLLSLIVFAISNVLPQNVGRAILGPFASTEAVAALNQQLGTDKPACRAVLPAAEGDRHLRLRHSPTRAKPAGPRC